MVSLARADEGGHASHRDHRHADVGRAIWSIRETSTGSSGLPRRQSEHSQRRLALGVAHEIPLVLHVYHYRLVLTQPCENRFRLGCAVSRDRISDDFLDTNIAL